MKYSRRSSIIVNAVPVYHKEANILAYAADKAVVLHYLNENRVVNLKAHDDTVTVLQFHPVKPHTLLSAGLDGKIIQWNMKTGDKIQQNGTRLPIFFMHDYFVGQEIKSKHTLRKYKPGFKEYATIVEDSSPIHCSVGGTNVFVAAITPTTLSIYWDQLGVSTKFTIPHKSKDELHCFNSVAAHPTEFIVATGNRMGEILIWYGLAANEIALGNSYSVTCLLQPDPDLLETVDDTKEPGIDADDTASAVHANLIPLDLLHQSDELFEPVRNEITERLRTNQTVPYYPVHPSRVHLNVLHWHCQLVQTLCFTPTGSHLLSGGLERVLVKWDMTECLGGPRQRRFVPRLSAPIHRIDCPGGPSEDIILITLANNEFHLVSGALTIIHSHRGFSQLPSVWLKISRSRSDYVVPHNLLTLPGPPSVPWVLTNGGLGSLQLIDLATDRLAVQKLDVTHQSIVPRDYQSRIPVAYSEVFLVAFGSSAKRGSWLATYERLVPQCVNLGDDQARVTWWKFTQCKADSQFPQFDATESYSLSHLNCPATDLGIVKHSGELHCYLLLADTRLLIWDHHSSSSTTVSSIQWSLKSCRLLSNSGYVRQDQKPCLTLCQPNHSQAQPLVFYSEQLTLSVFTWTDILTPESHRPLCTFDFSNHPEPLNPRSISDKVAVVPLPTDEPNAITEVSHLIAVNLRVVLVTASEPRSKRTTTVLATLTLHRAHEQQGVDEYEMHLVSISPDIHPVCFSVHPVKPWLAVGLMNGQATIFQVDRSSQKSVELCSVYTLPSVPAFPICERRSKHRGGRNRRCALPSSAPVGSDSKTSIKNKDAFTTKLLALDFLTSVEAADSTVDLVGLVETVVGRESNRRDLIVYGSSPGLTNQPTFNMIPKSDMNASVLRLADPVSIADRSGVHPPSLAGRKRIASQMDSTIEDALRQVSQYPLIAAPAPEQLLRQLMRDSTQTD